MYKIVPVSEIPSKAEFVSEDKLIDAYKIAVGLSVLCVKEQGIGLSAVQVGIPLHLFVIKNNLFADDYHAGFSHYINCKYEPLSGETYESLEGCLSLLDQNGSIRYFMVNRPRAIRLIGQQIIATSPIRFDNIDKVIDMNAGSSVYAHEIDHGYGIMIDKIGSEQIISKKKKKR